MCTFTMFILYDIDIYGTESVALHPPLINPYTGQWSILWEAGIQGVTKILYRMYRYAYHQQC